MPSKSVRHLGPLAKGTLVFLLGVILWGSFVRASGSGAGCGNHWPLCNGVILPEAGTWKTAVEFTHRVTSGLSLVLCAAICFVSFREAPKGSLLRKAGGASLFFVLTEAIIGAALVLLHLVENNHSPLRAISMSIHLVNTFFLLAAVTVTAQWASLRTPRLRPATRALKLWAVFSVLFMVILGASGAVTALGDTLFPVKTIAQGIAQDFSPTRSFLIALRLYHPLIALCVSLYLILFARWAILRYRAERPVVFHAMLLLALQVAQLLLGFINVLLLAPLAVQMAHLLVGDLVWINLVLLLSRLFVTGNPNSLPGVDARAVPAV